MAFDMAKFIARFSDEAREHIGKINDGLVILEKNPDDAETINAVFRSAHTIKGSSRMLKLGAIAEVAHKLEDSLGALRAKKIVYTKEFADLLFRGIDSITEMIEKTAAGQEITADNRALCEELASAAEGVMVPSSADRCGVTDSPPIPPGTIQEEEKKPGEKEVKLYKSSATVRISADKLDEIIKLMGEIVSNQNRLKQGLRDIKDIRRLAKLNLELVLLHKNRGNGNFPDAVSDSARLLLGEIKQLLSNIRDYSNVQELITDEIRTKALMMRMVPLSLVFGSLPRMVRDISQSLGKEVDIVTAGDDIEIDKKMMEKIGDPLVHMIRNAIDHGIEAPAERVKLGKPASGKIRVSASYDADGVLIRLTDDGRGIPLEMVKEKALHKKFLREDELAVMTESAVINLIFQPGFSTSAIITDISGRGVGMDVVKRNIVEDLRGTIRIETKAGAGTAFEIRLPMTLAVMRILLIEASGMTFGIVAHYVREIIRVPEADFTQVVDKKAIRLRNEFIPLVSLDVLLNLPVPEQRQKTGQAPLILIVHMGDENLGLMVDALLDEEDMVIKSLPSHMKNIKLVSGFTLSGKNEIVNVLHIPALVEAAKEMRGEGLLKGAPVVQRAGKSVNILVVDDSVNTREIEKSILEAYGYTVELAEDGMEALEKAKGFKYDIIITDVEMPRLDGFSLTEKLRNDETYKDIPIIIVTSREKEEDKRRGIMVGANAYIIKGSFDQTNLLETVQNLAG